jgi:hypothetical protein
MWWRSTGWGGEGGRAGDADYRPTDPQIAWHLGRFITNVRSISLDPVLMRQNWLSAYDFVTERGALFLGEYARSAQPVREVGDAHRLGAGDQRRPRLRPLLPGQVDRDRYERGSLAGTSRWTAILSIVVRPPASAETLRKNPLGLYVDAIDWSRELDVPPHRRPASAPPLPRAPPLRCRSAPRSIPTSPSPRHRAPAFREEQPMTGTLLTLASMLSLCACADAAAALWRRAPAAEPGKLPWFPKRRRRRRGRRRVAAAGGTAIAAAECRTLGPERAAGVAGGGGEPRRDARAEPGGYVNAVQVYAWSRRRALPALCGARAGERDRAPARRDLISVAAGDTARWVIGDTTSGSGAARRTHILVKPSAAACGPTSSSPPTGGSTMSSSRAPPATAMASISWTYPAGRAAGAPPRRRPRPRLDRAGRRGRRARRAQLRLQDRGRRSAVAAGARVRRRKPGLHRVPGKPRSGEAPPLFVLGRAAGPSSSITACAAAIMWSTGCSPRPSCGSANGGSRSSDRSRGG